MRKNWSPQQISDDLADAHFGQMRNGPGFIFVNAAADVGDVDVENAGCAQEESMNGGFSVFLENGDVNGELCSAPATVV